MTRASLSVAAAVLCLSGVVARAESGVAGSWTAKVPGPDGRARMEVTFTFAVDGSTTTGAVEANGQTFKQVDVKLDGATLSFAVEGEEQNRYVGTIAGDEIKMQVKYPSGENGARTWPFVMKRSSPSAGAGVTVDGAWVGEVPRGESRYITARFMLHADGSSLTGTVQAAGDEFPLVDGVIKGTVISFRVGATQGSYRGTVSVGEIQMKVQYDGGESGRVTLPFVLKRAR